MALIAHEIGDATLRNQAVDFMKLTIQPWFDGQDPTDSTYKDKRPLEKNNFVYDTTYSGTVTVRGLVGREQDYSNALYNDHMFHYGYFIYAAAVIARFEQQNTWLNNYKEKVNTLVRDIVMGILRHNIQKFNTFFAKLLYARVGIQLLPVTPISDYVLSRTWATAHAATLRALESEMSKQIDNVAGDGSDANKLLNNPKNPDVWCFTPEVRPTDVSGAAKCAGSIRVLYAWRKIILSANGLNDPNWAYEDTAKYCAKVTAQTESFRVRTMGADADLDKTKNSPTRGERLIYPNGLGNLDLLRSDAVHGTDINVLA